MKATEKELKALIARRHPRYEALESHWRFLDATYEGGRDWFDEHIFRYHKEGEKEFEDRVSRAYRFNHTREIVNLVNKYVFKGEIVRRSDVPEPIKAFRRSATKRNLTLDQFMRQVDIKASTFGRVYLFVDSTADGTAKTKAESDARKDRVYTYIVHPIDVLDMSFDDDQGFNWILVREYRRDDANPLDAASPPGERYRLWTKNEQVLIEHVGDGKKKSLRIVEVGPNPLGMVPAIPVDCFSVSEDLYESPALINDIAYLDRAVANYLSNLDAIIQDQTFSQLAMPAQAANQKELGDTLIEMGTKRVFLYDGTDGARPHYLSPDPKQAELIVTVVKQIINEIYHSVGVAGERTKQDNSMGIDNSSGVAKAYDFERVKSLLVTKAKALQAAENRLCELVMAWNGVADPNPDEEGSFVKYPESFDVRGIEQELDLSQKLSLLSAPKTIQRLQMSRLVDKVFPDISANEQKQVDSDIEKWPEEPALDVSRPSMVGKPTQPSQETG